VQQRFDEAIALHERAIEAGRERMPTRLPVLQIQLASCYGAAGRDREALEHFDLWWDRFTDVVGKDSVDAATYSSNRALSAMSLGRYDEAIPMLEHANRVLDAASGFDASLVAGGGLNLAISYVSVNRLEEGTALLQRVHTAVLEQLGPDSYDAGLVVAALGWAEAKGGRAEPALAYLVRAREIQSRHLGASHPELAVILEGIADAEQMLGRDDDAIEHYQGAIAIWDAAEPTLATRSFPSVAALAELHLSRGDDRKVLDLADRMLRRSNVAEGQEESFGRIRFVAARANWRMGDRDEARRRAQEAIELFRRNGRAARVEQVQQWLADVER
jgi:tetratricopeptide (TPR) repeat protein